jgi:hypothetical protein
MSKVYYFLLIISLSFISQVCRAQTAGGTVEGQVVDASTGEPLSFSSVMVFIKGADRDSLVSGAQTTDQGNFSVSHLPAGVLNVRISFIGYQPHDQVITIPTEGQKINMGKVVLSADTKVLKEVQVVGEKSSVEISPEKRIFNVDKNLTSVGGTAESLLRNVPSITIDENGNPNLRNMATTIYVNGKPTQLTLAQIPANQIATVEVISNPSARYDASTTGGIVNLVLKKNREPGYNGIASVGVGNNSRFDATLNLDWKRGKWNVTTLYSLNATRNPLTGYVRRNSMDAVGTTTDYFNQSTNISLNNQFQNGRIVADYNISEHSVITIAGTLIGGAYNTVSNQNYYYSNAEHAVTNYGTRNTTPHNDFTNKGLELDWTRQFSRKGEEIRLRTSITHNRVSNAGDWITTADTVTSTGDIPQEGYPVSNRIDGRIVGNQVLVQLDYVHPVSETAKWEFGLRSFTYGRDQKYLFYEVHSDTSALLQNYSQDAFIRERVNGVYALYSKQFAKQLSMETGLRLEQSSLDGYSRFDGTPFGYHYPSKTGQNIFQSFFPSFSLNKKIDETQEWNFSLSRKVGRPNFRHMFVGIQANDRQNITIGNPKVRPEFVNTGELSYNKTWNRESGSSLQWLATAYYIYEDHTIKPFVQPLATDSSILVTSFQNAKADIQYGVDNTMTYSVGRVSVLANINAYEMILQSVNFSNKLPVYNAKLNVTYKFGAGITAQITGQRRSRGPQLQGYQKAVNGADFSVRKAFMKNKASVTFIVNDIFNSRRFVTIYDQPATYQASMSRREIRYFKVTLQLPLGSITGKPKERKLDRPDIDFSN